MRKAGEGRGKRGGRGGGGTGPGAERALVGLDLGGGDLGIAASLHTTTIHFPLASLFLAEHGWIYCPA